MFKMIGILFFLGLVGFGVYTYTQYLESMYMKKEEALREKIRIAQRNAQTIKTDKMKTESQLTIEYDTLKKKIENKYALRESTMKKKYGDLDAIKKKLDAKAMASKKDMQQREKGLSQLSSRLAKKERDLKKKTKMAKRKLANIKNIKMECRIFDLRKIDEYIKNFQAVSYATRDKVNLLCGFDPSNRTLASRDACIRGRKDRERARSLLSLIYSVAPNVKQKKSYRSYVMTQRYRMQIK